MSEQTHIGSEHPLEYGGDISNTNNNFDVTNGIYVCPEDGLYAFYVAGLSGPSGACALSLEVDPDLFLIQLASTLPSSSEKHQSGVMVIAPCSANQTTYVQTRFEDTHSISGSNDSRTSTFSGFQISSYQF